MNGLERIAYRYFVAPLSPPWHWPSGTEQPTDWERLRIDRPNGGTLAGLYGRADHTPKGTVVCAHPTHPAAKGFFLHYGHARLLREAGYHVLLFDFSGFGESRPHDFHYPLDVLAAGREAQRHTPALPVGFLGVCFGAAWGLCACSRDDHPFAAAVLESPFTTCAGYYQRPWKNGKASLHRLFRQYFPRVLFRLGQQFCPDKAPPLRPIDHAPRVRGLEALLFIYGADDPLIPLHMGCRYAAACSPPVDLWEVPGGEHLRALVADPEAYRMRVTACFDHAFARWAGRSTHTTRPAPARAGS